MPPRGRGKGRSSGVQSRVRVSSSETSRSSKKDCVEEAVDLDVVTSEGESPMRKEMRSCETENKSTDAEEKAAEKDDVGRMKNVPETVEPFDPFALYPEDENSCAQDPYEDLAYENCQNGTSDGERLGNPLELTKIEPPEDKETASRSLDVEHESQPTVFPETASFTTIDVSSLGLGVASCSAGECPPYTCVGDGNVGSEVEIDTRSSASAADEFKQPKRRGRKPKEKSVGDGNVGSEVEIDTRSSASAGDEFKQPKRRGRKPKVKSVGDAIGASCAVITSDQPSQFPFPQSIVNGVVAIDMSNLKINTIDEEAVEKQQKLTLEGCGGLTVAHDENTNTEHSSEESKDIKPLVIPEEIKESDGNTGSKKGRKGIKKCRPKESCEDPQGSENAKKPKAVRRVVGKGKNLVENVPSALSSTSDTRTECGSTVVSAPASVSKGRRGGRRTTVKTEKDLLLPTRAAPNLNLGVGSDTEDLFDLVEDETLSLDMMAGFEKSEVVTVSRLKSTDFRIEEIDGEQNYFRRLAPGVQDCVVQRAQEISIKMFSSKEMLNLASTSTAPVDVDEH